MSRFKFGVLVFLMLVVPSLVCASTVYETTAFFIGENDTLIESFDAIAEDASYNVILTDLSSGDLAFSSLSMYVTTSTSNLGSASLIAGDTSFTLAIDVAAGDSWFINILGSGSDAGLLGLKVETAPGVGPTVPVPSAFLLFGSGMMALMSYRRRSLK